jgi:hypothetical protein
MARRVILLATLLAAWLSMSAHFEAQTVTGVIDGTINDAQSAVLPGGNHAKLFGFFQQRQV